MKISSLKILFPVLMAFFVSGIVKANNAPFLKYLNDSWVNAQFDSLTLDEKIAQLMMITVYPNQNEASKIQSANLIEKWNPGGILVMQGSPVKTADWINFFQEKAKTPMLVAIDGEWGLAMRTDSTIQYPNAQALGAVQDSTYLIQMGHDLGEQLKQMGIHVNFAPVADVNTNPNNPVINFRSFGEDKKNVAQKAWWLAKGMQDVQIVAVAKHFPGHGDTHVDSHKALPLIEHDKNRIDSVESFPFRYLAQKGISGIMTAHLNVPALDKSGTPSSLSQKIVTGYLKNEIGFSGFVFTDAINMKGVRTKNGNPEAEALKAGNHMVEFVPDLEQAISSVKKAIQKGQISVEEINEKCRYVLALKRWCNLHEYEPTKTQKLTYKLNSPYFEVVNRKLIQNSFTVLTNQNILPLQELDKQKIASVQIGRNSVSGFQKMLSNYTDVDHFYIDKNAAEKDLFSLKMKLKNYNLVIAGVEGIQIYPSGKYGTTEIQRRAVSEIISENKTLIAFFGNAYALKYFENIHHAKGLILAYQNNKLTQELAAQLIFGANNATGKLPVSVDERFKLNQGYEVKKNEILGYSIPEEVGINSKILSQKIDSIAQLGVDSAAYPGCQVLVAKNGKIVFHKSYGFHTYMKNQKLENSDIFDWASVTKVTGPLPAIIKLVDENTINLDKNFSEYYPEWKNSNKKNLNLREILSHQARLPAWIPFWSLCLKENGKLDENIFKSKPSSDFSVRISENLYMNNGFKKTMFDTIRNSKLLPRKRYLYSGLTFYIFPELIENLTQQPYEKYVKQNFYLPLGATTITYNAYLHFPQKKIVPTEVDDFFRKEILRGFVHDEGASMMGGVSGNAGLFGNANDLAKLFQMYLQFGYYGGRRYFSEKTVKEFIKIQYPENKNRRGLGFDKPLIENNKNRLEDAYPAVSAGKNSFGHSGYTGTFVWADPDAELLYIFLSNRVHPTRENQKLYQFNIRTAIHQSIYDSIERKN